MSLIARYPTGREDVQRAQLGFSELALNIPHRDLVRVDPGDLSAQAHVRPRTLRQVIKLLVRSCRRWQLYGLQMDLRGNLLLGMHLRFRDPRRSQVAPKDVDTLLNINCDSVSLKKVQCHKIALT